MEFEAGGLDFSALEILLDALVVYAESVGFGEVGIVGIGRVGVPRRGVIVVGESVGEGKEGEKKDCLSSVHHGCVTIVSERVTMEAFLY